MGARLLAAPPVLDRPIVEVYRSAANFINEHRIDCSVLGGVDPDTGVIGRDLDIYVPRTAQARKLIGHVHAQFKALDLNWVTPMHPLWGLRCIGVSPEEYGEFHIVSGMRFGSLDLANLRPLEPEIGQLGLPFDPALIFAKLITRHSRSILEGLDIWSERPLPAFVLPYQESIRHRFDSRWPGTGAFVDACFAADSIETRSARRLQFLRLIAIDWRRHPGHALHTVAVQARRKIMLLNAPCAPYVSLSTELSSHEVQIWLQEKLGRAFLRIEVRTEPWSWVARRRLQARQSLAVHITRDSTGRDPNADVLLDLTTNPERDPLDVLSHAIYEELVAMNQRWRDQYPAR